MTRAKKVGFSETPRVELGISLFLSSLADLTTKGTNLVQQPFLLLEHPAMYKEIV
jgi:hypothetical protein